MKLVCEVCGKTVTNSYTLTVHMRIHEGVKPIKCPHCKASFSQKSNLNTHILSVHTAEKRYICHFCSKTTSLLSGLKRHMLVHTGEKKYMCSVCHKSFACSSSLKCHVRIHSDVRAYKCLECDASFKQQINLKNHSAIHTGEKKHKCPFCNKRFARSTSLTSHIFVHTKDGKYKCELCVRSFAVSTQLKIHLRKHAEETPSQNLKCEQSLKESNGVMKLTRRGVPKKKKIHECTVCNRQFKFLSYMKRHARVHTLEKSKKCKVCDKEFSSSKGLRCHIHVHKVTKRPNHSAKDVLVIQPLDERKHLDDKNDEQNVSSYIYPTYTDVTRIMQDHQIEENCTCQ